MCIKFLKKLFSHPTIPHPREKLPWKPPEGTGSILYAVRQAWLDEWEVSEPYFWTTNVDIEIVPDLPYPAAAVSEERRIMFHPDWICPGALAHEAAHISYSLMSEAMKVAFSMDYHATLGQDELLDYLYKKESYIKTNGVEAHAEIYRFLGHSMPEILKRYYPNLI